MPSPQKPTQSVKEDEEINILIQTTTTTTKTRSISRSDANKMELNAFPDREFKITVIEILIKVKKVMHEEIENVNIDKQY